MTTLKLLRRNGILEYEEIWSAVSVCDNCLHEFNDVNFTYCPYCGEEIVERESEY